MCLKIVLVNLNEVIKNIFKIQLIQSKYIFKPKRDNN